MADFDVRTARGKVLVSGEFDLEAAPAVRAALQGATEDADAHLIIDLSAVTFIDSSGLNELIRATKQAGRVTLEDVHPTAMQLLELTGVTELFDIT